MTNKFISIMERIGRDIKVAWGEVVKYLPAVEGLASLLFPGKTTTNTINAVNLIQQSVATVEQKFAAAGMPTGTGPQKLAQVTAMVGPVVTQLLTAEGIAVDQAYLNSIVSAVVGILNVPSTTVSA